MQTFFPHRIPLMKNKDEELLRNLNGGQVTMYLMREVNIKKKKKKKKVFFCKS